MLIYYRDRESIGLGWVVGGGGGERKSAKELPAAF